MRRCSHRVTTSNQGTGAPQVPAAGYDGFRDCAKTQYLRSTVRHRMKGKRSLFHPLTTGVLFCNFRRRAPYGGGLSAPTSKNTSPVTLRRERDLASVRRPPVINHDHDPTKRAYFQKHDPPSETVQGHVHLRRQEGWTWPIWSTVCGKYWRFWALLHESSKLTLKWNAYIG